MIVAEKIQKYIFFSNPQFFCIFAGRILVCYTKSSDEEDYYPMVGAVAGHPNLR
jgi:hypothetical protein